MGSRHSGVEAQLIGLGDDALGCDGFWVTEGDTVRVSIVLLSVPCPREYQERFVHRPPNRRRKYLAGEAEGGTVKEALYASLFPHSQECRDHATVFVFMANLHSCLNDIERMCRERSEGSGSSGRAAIQSHTNERGRWWQYGGGIVLDSLVKHQEQTSVGRIAQRRSKEPAKKLRRSGAYD